MSDASPPTILVLLQPDDGLGRIVVGLKPFLRFGEDISFGLEDLVLKQRAGGAPRAPVGMIIRETALHPWRPESTS